MIICNLSGGLGNQMFQYACAKSVSLKLDLKLKFTTDFLSEYKSHNGLELERVFGIKLDIASCNDLEVLIGRTRTSILIRRLLAKNKFRWLAPSNFLAEPHFEYWPKILERSSNGAYLQGYWQSENYFKDYSGCIRKDFKFKECLSSENLKIVDLMRKQTSIGVHIRRGDYLANQKTLSVHGICSVEYYNSAIEIMLERYPEAYLFFFSDEPEWVVDNFKSYQNNVIVIDNNKGLSSYFDMFLMSLCDHNIIANSTFSWWAAWLNSNASKKIIAPSKWFANSTSVRDLFPSGWELI